MCRNDDFTADRQSRQLQCCREFGKRNGARLFRLHFIAWILLENPNHLLDILIERLNLKNDAALSRALEVAPPVISKIRHRRLPVGASMLIRMHEVSTMSVRELRDLMGDRRTKYRLSDAQGKPKPVIADIPQANG